MAPKTSSFRGTLYRKNLKKMKIFHSCPIFIKHTSNYKICHIRHGLRREIVKIYHKGGQLRPKQKQPILMEKSQHEQCQQICCTILLLIMQIAYNLQQLQKIIYFSQINQKVKLISKSKMATAARTWVSLLKQLGSFLVWAQFTQFWYFSTISRLKPHHVINSIS